MRRRWLLVPAVLALAGGGALAAGLARSGDTAAPSSPPSSPPAGVVATTSAALPTSPTAAVSRAAVPVPGSSGDGYHRNVTTGATCAPAGALGFTTQGRPVQCATAAADPTLRWRTP